jgi:hypothetical protein
MNLCLLLTKSALGTAGYAAENTVSHFHLTY